MNIFDVVQHNGIAGTAAGFAIGLACANVPTIIHFVVTSKVISAWIRKDPALAESIVNSLKKEVDAVEAADIPTAPVGAGEQK